MYSEEHKQVQTEIKNFQTEIHIAGKNYVVRLVAPPPSRPGPYRWPPLCAPASYPRRVLRCGEGGEGGGGERRGT